MDADATGQPVAPGAATVSFAPEDSSCKLLELERSLAAKDAIMEPGVMDSLRTYVASGGKPAAAIELLSENYRGYAQMSSLVCRWLELTAETEPPRSAQARRRGWRRRRGWIQRRGLSRGAVGGRGGDASAAATPATTATTTTPQGGHPVARTATATPPLSVGGPRRRRRRAARGEAAFARRGTSSRSSSDARSTRARWTR